MTCRLSQVLSPSLAMARPQPPPAPAGRPVPPPPPPLPRRLPPLSWLPRGGAGRQPGETAQAAAAPQAPAPAVTAFGSWLPGKSAKPPGSSAAADAGVPGQCPARASESAQRAQPALGLAPARGPVREAQAAREALRGGGAPLVVLLGAAAAVASALEPLFQVQPRASRRERLAAPSEHSGLHRRVRAVGVHAFLGVRTCAAPARLAGSYKE